LTQLLFLSFQKYPPITYELGEHGIIYIELKLFSGHCANEYNFFFVDHLVLTKIDNYTLLDCSLISSPEITEHCLDLNLKVTFSLLEASSDRQQPRLCAKANIYTSSSNNLLFFQETPSSSCLFKRIFLHFFTGKGLFALHICLLHEKYWDGFPSGNRFEAGSSLQVQWPAFIRM
jgi:hypothetical protein